jgi:hypothetical protein
LLLFAAGYPRKDDLAEAVPRGVHPGRLTDLKSELGDLRRLCPESGVQERLQTYQQVQQASFGTAEATGPQQIQTVRRGRILDAPGAKNECRDQIEQKRLLTW